MILMALKDHIIAHPRCSLEQLALAFNLTEDGISAMLAVWQKRGQLKTIISKENGKQVFRFTWLAGNELPVKIHC